MAATIVTPCRVPWAISPSGSGVTLQHAESDGGCKVLVGAGGIHWEGLLVEITFEFCYYTRTAPHPDSEGIEAIGYQVDPCFKGSLADYRDWRKEQWVKTGYCPDSGFFVARQSPWLQSVPDVYQKKCRHYVVYGRDGHVELIAKCFQWRAWNWNEFESPKYDVVVNEGSGTD